MELVLMNGKQALQLALRCHFEAASHLIKATLTPWTSLRSISAGPHAC